jgi:hypothetical protein
MPIGRTHLVIPDSHSNPNHNNDRFDWLGKLILDIRPDVIVNIGDGADMASLCSYDFGKKSFEGRRYKNDIAASINANERVHKPIQAYNEIQRSNHKTRYKPEWHYLIGNHEHRITKVAESQPNLEGVVSIDDLRLEEFGWQVHPFLKPVRIDGVTYAHYFSSGVMGRPVGGEHPAHALITKKLTSCVMGHTHTRDHSERTDANGRRIQSLVVGCYLDEDQHEDYAGEANKLWWKGVVVLHDVHDGMFEPEWINIRMIKDRYKND